MKPEFLPQLTEAPSEDKKTIFSRAGSNKFWRILAYGWCNQVKKLGYWQIGLDL